MTTNIMKASEANKASGAALYSSSLDVMVKVQASIEAAVSKGLYKTSNLLHEIPSPLIHSVTTILTELGYTVDHGSSQRDNEEWFYVYWGVV